METHRQTINRNRTPEYRSYSAAKNRCRNQQNKDYRLYGGRGVLFVFESFSEFIGCIGERPSPAHSLDRIDNDGHYECSNVRWATPKEQTLNRRVNVTFRGETATEASRRLGGEDSLVKSRLRYGWSNEEAFTRPVSK